MKVKATVCLSEFPDLLVFLRGDLTVEELNERVFNEGFEPVEWQMQYSPKQGYYYVIHGYVPTKFVLRNWKHFLKKRYDLGWTLFLSK